MDHRADTRAAHSRHRTPQWSPHNSPRSWGLASSAGDHVRRLPPAVRCHTIRRVSLPLTVHTTTGADSGDCEGASCPRVGRRVHLARCPRRDTHPSLAARCAIDGYQPVVGRTVAETYLTMVVIQTLSDAQRVTPARGTDKELALAHVIRIPALILPR